MGAYTFVYNIQEEAHRFAVKNSQGAKIKTMTRSTLEKIKGIGPKKAKILLAAMPLGKIRTAEKDELIKVRGISKSDAENIYQYYHKSKGK
jgi:excinuclease ABC subunit C